MPICNQGNREVCMPKVFLIFCVVEVESKKTNVL